MCLEMSSWQGDSPRDHPFGALTLLRKDLTVLQEHKGNTLYRAHSIDHPKTHIIGIIGDRLA